MYIQSTTTTKRYLALSTIVVINLGCILVLNSHNVRAESMSLAAIMPKLEAIYEDASSLLIKNGELKAIILSGLKAQAEEKLKSIRDNMKLINKPQMGSPTAGAAPAPGQVNPAGLIPVPPKQDQQIDYSELDDFNRWVDANLEYAVKNTQASIEALKEEAAANNGMIDYTEQAIKDGIEGVKYWQSCVIFQDKTLKNEPFDTAESPNH